jgi:hypothetical protein
LLWTLEKFDRLRFAFIQLVKCVRQNHCNKIFKFILFSQLVGLTTTSRVHTLLKICVESLDFDTQAGS